MAKAKLTKKDAENLQVRFDDLDQALWFVPEESKGGNVYWTLPTANNSQKMYGVPVTPLGKALPGRLTIINPETGEESVVINLTKGLTENGSRPKVSGGKKVSLPTQGEDERMVQATISVRKDGMWNLRISATNLGEGGSAKAQDLLVFVDARNPGNPRIS